jgi:dihydroorotase-like cyclic amidohydrolase
VPVPFLGGVAHGAGVHSEPRYLVQAGLSPAAALRAATPARRFSLDDRGRIAEGLRADLLLVDGDPTTRSRARSSAMTMRTAATSLSRWVRRTYCRIAPNLDRTSRRL